MRVVVGMRPLRLRASRVTVTIVEAVPQRLAPPQAVRANRKPRRFSIIEPLEGDQLLHLLHHLFRKERVDEEGHLSVEILLLHCSKPPRMFYHLLHSFNRICQYLESTSVRPWNFSNLALCSILSSTNANLILSTERKLKSGGEWHRMAMKWEKVGPRWKSQKVFLTGLTACRSAKAKATARASSLEKPAEIL